jgi:hypothetical protein
MRKRMISQSPKTDPAANKHWLDLEDLALTEVSSEDAAHPIESALMLDNGPGWRAAEPGKQTVRLVFDKPQKVHNIHLLFREDERERTHEFVLRWSPDSGHTYREIVRQQFNFSPHGSTQEVEDYDVELNGMTALELIIVPDVSGGTARASVAELRLA